MSNILNEDQKKAVYYNGNKPLIIEAGPGAGKTHVLIERVKFLIKDKKIDPESLLVITFTVKAAEQLKNRLKEEDYITPDMINKMQISTIHSFCNKIISEYSPKPYNILGDNLDSSNEDVSEKQNMFVKKHLKDLGFNYESQILDYEINSIINKYDEYTTFGVDTEGLVKYLKETIDINPSYIKLIEDTKDKNGEYFEFPRKTVKKSQILKDSWYDAKYLAVAKSYPKYIELLEEEGYLDYNFLQIKALDLIKNPKIREKLKFKNILIDEFQDTDPIQLQIFKVLKEDCDSFTVVGDDDQSIYSFRGANPQYFTDFKNDENSEVVTLQVNYRSTPDIVSHNESFIKNYRPEDSNKLLKAYRNENSDIYTMINVSEEDEAKNIVKIIKNLITEGKIKQLSDIGILMKSTKFIDKLLTELNNANINYSIVGNPDLFDNDEIKSIMTLLWYVCGKHPLKYTGRWEFEWFNLKAFTNENYCSSKMFNLSETTMNILSKLEDSYREFVVEQEKIVYKQITNKTSHISKFSGVFGRDDEIIEEIEKNVLNENKKIEISEMNTESLKNIGITNEHDLNFFNQLYNIKKEFYDSKIGDKHKITLLELFYKLLNINRYLEKKSKSENLSDDKILMNLAALSKTIYNYENMIDPHDVKGLFRFIKNNIENYGSPNNNSIDNINAIQLLTVHKSKGLEFPVVIVASMEQDVFPRTYDIKKETGKWKSFGQANFYTPPKYLKYKNSDLNLEKELQENEEKRVIYVAMTRTEDLLILSSIPHKKNKAVITTPNIINELKLNNPYLNDINLNNLENIKKTNANIKKIEEENIKLFYTNFADFNDCAYKYKLAYEYNFKYSDTEQITYGIKVHEVLDNIHSQIKELGVHNIDIDKLVQNEFETEINNKETEKVIKNIQEYYNNIIPNLNVQDSELPFNITKDNYELTGKIDLINKKHDGELEVIDFKYSDSFFIKRNPQFYKNQIFIYVLALKENPKYKDIIIKQGGIYSMKNQEFIEIKVTEEDIINMDDILTNTAEKIKNKNFKKNLGYCERCEFNDKICFYKKNKENS